MRMMLLSNCRRLNFHELYVCIIAIFIFGASAIGLCEFEYLSPCTLDHFNMCKERHTKEATTGLNTLKQLADGSSTFRANMNTSNLLGSANLDKSTVYGKSIEHSTQAPWFYESFTYSNLSTTNVVGSSQSVQSNFHRTTTDHAASLKPKGVEEVTSEKLTTLKILYKDCHEAHIDGNTQSGIYKIAPDSWIGSDFSVVCSMELDGGWTVIQRRTDGVTDFYRNWTSYRVGFGSFEGDFWLGNDKIFYLTNQKTYALRIDIIKSNRSPVFEDYSFFSIGNESTKYQLFDLGSATGTAGNGMPLLGSKFSTYDQDNDGCEESNCAENHRGGWWYSPSDPSLNACRSCESKSDCYHYQNGSDVCYQVCTLSNPNGDYNGGDGQNIFWDLDNNFCYHEFLEMKIRPSQ